MLPEFKAQSILLLYQKINFDEKHFLFGIVDMRMLE